MRTSARLQAIERRLDIQSPSCPITLVEPEPDPNEVWRTTCAIVEHLSDFGAWHNLEPCFEDGQILRAALADLLPCYVEKRIEGDNTLYRFRLCGRHRFYYSQIYRMKHQRQDGLPILTREYTEEEIPGLPFEEQAAVLERELMRSNLAYEWALYAIEHGHLPPDVVSDPDDKEFSLNNVYAQASYWAHDVACYEFPDRETQGVARERRWQELLEEIHPLDLHLHAIYDSKPIPLLEAKNYVGYFQKN
jgi:hypothetical protein